ncbi:MAG: hypothetical protein ACXWJK_06355 [Burkholderiaceae bacterium]
MKLIGWIVLGWSVLLAPTHAASFDCEKANKHVEKLICTDDELSTLDVQMDGYYRTALLDPSIADVTKQTQKQWLEKRNSCSDAACVKSAYESRMRQIFPDNKPRAVVPGKEFQASLDSKDWVFVFTTTKIAKEKAIALRNINNQDHPDRQTYNEIGLRDSSSKVRSTAAYFYKIELNKLTPILLKIMVSDPDQDVRFSAAMNLTRHFNFDEYTDEDIQALEVDLPLVERAIRTTESNEMGRKLLGMLDFVWCDMTADSRKKLLKFLRSDLTIRMKIDGQVIVDTSLNFSAKEILNKKLEESCSH